MHDSVGGPIGQRSPRSSPPVFGDLFAPVAVLTVAARLELAGLLAVPGQALAIVPGDLALLALPSRPELLVAVGDAIVAGLDRSVLSLLSGYRLDAVVPVLQGCRPDAVARRLPVRLRGLLDRGTSAVAFVERTVGEIAECPGIGPHGVATVVTATVAAGVAAIAAGASADPSVDDVAVVLAYDRSHGATLRGVLAEVAASGPPDVRVAAERILTVGAGSGPDRRLRVLDAVLAAAGDVRDRAVFEHTVLTCGRSLARSEVAAALGIGLERLRQLRMRTIERVDAAVVDCPVEIGDLAARVAERVGSAAPCTAIDALFAEGGLAGLDDSRSRLLLRIAGPYRPVDGHRGWVALDPVELIAETGRVIHEDGGVRLREHVAKELAGVGMTGEHLASWLAEQPVRVIDDLVVATTGTCGDVTERLLHAYGRAMTRSELAGWVPGGPAGIDALWSARDRRFVVTGDDTVALTEWDDTAADNPDGREPPARMLRVAVDAGVIAGAGGPVPAAVAHGLGLRRGVRCSFPTRFGPVVVGFDGDGATRGSIRPVVMAVGAAIGDELVIGLDGDGRQGTVGVVRAARSYRAASPAPQESLW